MQRQVFEVKDEKEEKKTTFHWCRTMHWQYSGHVSKE